MVFIIGSVFASRTELREAGEAGLPPDLPHGLRNSGYKLRAEPSTPVHRAARTILRGIRLLSAEISE